MGCEVAYNLWSFIFFVFGLALGNAKMCVLSSKWMEESGLMSWVIENFNL
jgi:hypothetical protein